MSKRKAAKPAQSVKKVIIKVSNSAPLWMRLTVVLIPLILYANTIGHGYAVDDDIVIVQNTFTHQGIAGIDDIFTHDAFDGAGFLGKDLLGPGRYRPLSLATFAIEWEFFGSNPQVSHFINVVLFAITVLLLFMLLRLLLENIQSSLKDVVPFLSALLFAAHPIHVEAVANIKGRDEILALLFALLAMIYAVRFAKSQHIKWLVLIFPIFLLSLLSKESAYPLIAVVPVAAFVFFAGRERKRVYVASLVLFAAALVGFLIRYDVVGLSFEESTDLMNNPFVDASTEQRFATIFFVLGKYLQLLIFPHPLTNDYYPYHIALHTFSDPLVIGAVLLNLSLVGLGLWLTFKKKHPLGFAILFYFLVISIVSNVVAPVGTFMSERLAFIPSVGFCFAISWVLVSMGKKVVETHSLSRFVAQLSANNKLGALLLLVMLTGFAYKTVTRNNDWKDSDTLFLADADVSSNSAKANNAAGGVFFARTQSEKNPAIRKELLQLSMRHLEKAVAIYPKYAPAWLTLGNDYYFLENDVAKAIAAYRNASPNAVATNLSAIAAECIGRRAYDDAIQCYEELIRMFPDSASYLVSLGEVYGRDKGDVGKALKYLVQAEKLDPNNPVMLGNIAAAYHQLGNSTEAERYSRLAEAARNR